MNQRLGEQSECVLAFLSDQIDMLYSDSDVNDEIGTNVPKWN